MALLGKDGALRLIDRVLDRARFPHTEVLYLAESSHLARFAHNEIHQSMSERSAALCVRVVREGRSGSFFTNGFDDARLTEAVAMAGEAARHGDPDPAFAGFPEPEEAPDVSIYRPETGEFGAEGRTKAVRRMADRVRAAKREAFGVFSNGACEVAVGAAGGLRRYALLSDYFVNLVAAGEGSGFASRTGPDLSAFDPEETAAEAAHPPGRSEEPEDASPGEWTVVLSPYATHELVCQLGVMGGGSLAHQEGQSYTSGRLGRKVTGGNIHIWDDALDPRGFSIGFDFEGTAKKCVDLIREGTLEAVCYDSHSAARAKTTNTGHALMPPNPWGPLPGNLFMAPGDRSEEELVLGVERGLYVTRFHYVCPVNWRDSEVTGMTRDGVFLIRNGRIRGPVRSLRFTENLLEAFSRVTGIGSRLVLVGSGDVYARRFPLGAAVPAVRIEAFRFNGVSDF